MEAPGSVTSFWERGPLGGIAAGTASRLSIMRRHFVGPVRLGHSTMQRMGSKIFHMPLTISGFMRMLWAAVMINPN